MGTTNRSVSFVSRLELDIDDGKVLPHALLFADVDNDGGDELVVGTTGGYLYVFRGRNSAPWCRLTELGEITCVVVGNITESKENRLLVINTEGRSFLYRFSPERRNDADSETSQADLDVQTKTSHGSQLVHVQLLQANVKMMLLGDVDGDGLNELILCHTDRTVSACRWDQASEEFELLQQWKLHQSLGAITLHRSTENGLPQIIASQPGCSYAILHPQWQYSKSGEKCSENARNSGTDISYNPMSRMSRSQNPAVSCQIVGDICKGQDSQKGYFALCTLDGTIKLIEDNEALWSFQVGHQLFAINKLDVLANGKEEVIVCAWNGFTYIVDHDRNIVKFQFGENVQAFCAGQYALEDSENVVSLVYANFRNKLYVYYDVQLPQLTTSDFLTEAGSSDRIQSLLAELGAETEEEKRLMIRYCMYGIRGDEEHEALSGEKLELFRKKSNET